MQTRLPVSMTELEDMAVIGWRWDTAVPLTGALASVMQAVPRQHPNDP